MEKMSGQIDSLKQQVTELKEQKSSSMVETNPFNDGSIAAVTNEMMKREQKSKNLVIYGILPAEDDMATIKNLFSDVGVPISETSVMRIGNCGTDLRPLLVRFRYREERDNFYNNLRMLKGKEKWRGVSIAPDMTKMQYAEDKKIYMELLQEAKNRNSQLDEKAGRWKIVGRSTQKRLIFIQN